MFVENDQITSRTTVGAAQAVTHDSIRQVLPRGSKGPALEKPWHEKWWADLLIGLGVWLFIFISWRVTQ